MLSLLASEVWRSLQNSLPTEVIDPQRTAGFLIPDGARRPKECNLRPLIFACSRVPGAWVPRETRLR